MMNNRLDCLIVNAPSRAEVYGSLAPLTSCEPPVWGGLIAQYLLGQGFGVEMLDAEAMGLSVADTALRVEAARPRLAVFPVYGHQPSASTQCMPAASLVAKVVQQCSPKDIKTLVLGTHASALPEETLAEGNFDFVCTGEGPLAIELALIALLERKMPENISRSEPMPEWEINAALKRQAWQLLDMKLYRPLVGWDTFTARHSSGGYASVQTSLGCPFRCTFCCINAPFGGSGIRFWSADTVVNQIEELVNHYGISNIKIPDEMFLLNPSHVYKICLEIVRRGLGDHLNMWAYARIDTVRDDALLSLMRRSGFTRLGIGIESASKHVRDGVEKGRFNNEEITSVIKRVHGHGFLVGANYIFGLPDDTFESMKETLDMALHLNTFWANFYCAMAYPGSKLHADARRLGWTLPESPGGPGWIGYSQHSYDSRPLDTEKLSYQEVLDYRDIAWMNYFNRPEYFYRLRLSFGENAFQQINAMISGGLPARRHRAILAGR